MLQPLHGTATGRTTGIATGTTTGIATGTTTGIATGTTTGIATGRTNGATTGTSSGCTPHKQWYSQFQNGWPKWQMADWTISVTSLLVSYCLSLRHTYCPVLPFTMKSHHLPFTLCTIFQLFIPSKWQWRFRR